MEDWLRDSCLYWQRQEEKHFLLRDPELLADSPDASPEHSTKESAAPQIKQRKRPADKSKAAPSPVCKKTKKTTPFSV